MKRLVFIIPCFNPDELFVKTILELEEFEIGYESTKIVINDGSTIGNTFFKNVVNRPNIIFIDHHLNFGKGQAIKSGLAKIQEILPDTDYCITVDSDGQHSTQDIIKICKYLQNQEVDLILGSRKITFLSSPLRSFLGNWLTRIIFFLVTGTLLKDTQTGLRAYKKDLFPMLLSMPEQKYEFETQVLLSLILKKINFIEIDIETIYFDKNKKSNFNFFLDSYKIYKVIFQHLLKKIYKSFSKNKN